MAARSKAWVCGCSFVGIAVSNPAGDMDVLLLECSVCVVRYRSLRRADHSSREVLPNFACLKQCDLKTSMMIRPRTTRDVLKKRETNRKTGVRTTNWVTETFPHVGIMLGSELHVPTAKAADLT